MPAVVTRWPKIASCKPHQELLRSSNITLRSIYLGNAAVLGLHISQSLESSLVCVRQQTKRIPEAKRRLGSDLALEAHLQGGGSRHAGRRSEGDYAGDGGKYDNQLHHCG
jgi:hypothetical protein